MIRETSDLQERLGRAFKAYDIRGRVPEELDPDIAYSIGRAYVELVRPKRVVVGHDVRLSSPSLATKLASGLSDGGADVYDLGLCGTEEVYFSTFHHAMDGGIMVTASHNPSNYNGMKLVREDAYPISEGSGLKQIQKLTAAGDWARDSAGKVGRIREFNARSEYISHLLGYVDMQQLRPLRIVTNAGNGCAGPVIDALESWLPFEFIKIQHQPDGAFPNGIPNPLLPENRSSTAEAVLTHEADLGIAWDGDFDRCFFFDESGRFIEGYYIVGLLASTLLAQNPGSKIIHDPRLTWNTIKAVKEANGLPVQSKTGHAFIKERMRAEDAIYGGEMSAHHYFRDFRYCDSGMIPWLLVVGLMSRKNEKLSTLISDRQAEFPVSGEINRKVSDPDWVIAEIEARYKPAANSVDYTDGLSVEYQDWRFNLRKSNTEPILRLNVEARLDQALMSGKTRELLKIIDGMELSSTSAESRALGTDAV